MKLTAASLILAAGAIKPAIAASCPAFNYAAPLIKNPLLPNPYQLQDGTPVTTLADWNCRRDELLDLFQQYELGDLPPKPHRLGTRFYDASNTLALTAYEGDKTIAWNVSIQYPKTGTGPFPAIIAYGGPSIPIPDGVAVLIFNNDAMAQQNSASSRGIGKFYDLYGKNATASAMMAWSWGVSRIMDALEDTPRANIDPTRVGVTGCSRNGKGALVAGAFEPRIALTIPQESGSGGSACWRLSDWMYANGTVTQTASEITGENVWFSQEFAEFSPNGTIPLLPVDHHELAALVAPRGLLVIDNTAYDWLGPWSDYGCMTAGHTAYKALGVPDHMGYSQIGGHLHCSFPTAQQGPELTAFFQRFLLNNASASTTVWKTDVVAPFVLSQWADWTWPTLA
ncbi:hypothetical protein TWF694_001799 [Orbilia ellipsospora]|uniref:(4-O-methyl)-D-glucuronate--lignin esterase n=1 Tax=Orbilia ellipsospora TaxID=2528407 RepID=A0AAV9X3P5_9PEZI